VVKKNKNDDFHSIKTLFNPELKCQSLNILLHENSRQITSNQWISNGNLAEQVLIGGL